MYETVDKYFIEGIVYIYCILGIEEAKARGATYRLGPELEIRYVCRHQILTSNVDPRTVRVKTFIMTVDP